MSSSEPEAAPVGLCHCGEPAPIRGDGDPWEGRLDGYCYACASCRCDCYPNECPVKYPSDHEAEIRVDALTYERLRKIARKLNCTVNAALEEVLREFKPERGAEV